ERSSRKLLRKLPPVAVTSKPPPLNPPTKTKKKKKKVKRHLPQNPREPLVPKRPPRRTRKSQSSSTRPPTRASSPSVRDSATTKRATTRWSPRRFKRFLERTVAAALPAATRNPSPKHPVARKLSLLQRQL